MNNKGVESYILLIIITLIILIIVIVFYLFLFSPSLLHKLIPSVPNI
ncbi:MAG: hypothetical protein BJBARM5_0304 [Candidatus Parvarchaeum acidophilus ARMAN-5]|jgi:flagellar basal body-associated protein FliL|uniref:Uncharacterized protein n=1 Tax=Candidatus Parvarchaeum acidophilus ARMAN-5 TaxID=662762 RepID=D6GV04_PARA5|nr:MAG: hypothetical protein BJBARM5_0304 [Candidatus Parvarchaeum acidophilus ARMAN-5]